jgi:hypothetical protein
MRFTLVLTVLVALGAGAGIHRAEADLPGAHSVRSVAKAEICPDLRKGISYYRTATWKWQRLIGISRTKVSSEKVRTCEYAQWVVNLWRGRAAAAKAKHEKIQASERREISEHVRRLERGLAGSPMSGTGEILVEIGKRYGISPYFMAGIAATESSLGHAACSNNRYNVWGLASCVNSWPVPYFNSWYEAITFFADFLRDRWPTATTSYDYHGYAACSTCWGAKTASHMRNLFGVDNYTRFG